MANYNPPYTITSKILKLTSEISEQKYIKEGSKSDQKILTLMKQNSQITIGEICSKLSMSESGVSLVPKLQLGNAYTQPNGVNNGQKQI